jgi:hypothetical protein
LSTGFAVAQGVAYNSHLASFVHHPKADEFLSVQADVPAPSPPRVSPSRSLRGRSTTVSSACI